MPLYLSPSQNHRFLMDQMQPALAYDGGPLRPWQNKLRRKLRQLIGFPDVERPARDIKPFPIAAMARPTAQFADSRRLHGVEAIDPREIEVVHEAHRPPRIAMHAARDSAH